MTPAHYMTRVRHGKHYPSISYPVSFGNYINISRIYVKYDRNSVRASQFHKTSQVYSWSWIAEQCIDKRRILQYARANLPMQDGLFCKRNLTKPVGWHFRMVLTQLWKYVWESLEQLVRWMCSLGFKQPCSIGWTIPLFVGSSKHVPNSGAHSFAERSS